MNWCYADLTVTAVECIADVCDYNVVTLRQTFLHLKIKTTYLHEMMIVMNDYDYYRQL